MVYYSGMGIDIISIHSLNISRAYIQNMYNTVLCCSHFVFLAKLYLPLLCFGRNVHHATRHCHLTYLNLNCSCLKVFNVVAVIVGQIYVH